jgi:hypothetical protein
MGAGVKSQVCGYDNRGSKALALANETAVTQTMVHWQEDLESQLPSHLSAMAQLREHW